MILFWLILAWRNLKWFLKLPAAREVAVVNPNDPCPACGHREGTIRCVHRGTQVLVQHTCGMCGARYHELPIVKLETDRVWAAVPRTEIELKEEYSPMFGASSNGPVN